MEVKQYKVDYKREYQLNWDLICDLIYEWNLFPSEIQNLQCKHIQWEDSKLQFPSRPRTKFSISERHIGALKAQTRFLEPDDFVFQNRFGNQISKRSIEKKIQLSRNSVSGKFSISTQRNQAIRKMYREGYGIEELKSYFGFICKKKIKQKLRNAGI